MDFIRDSISQVMRLIEDAVILVDGKGEIRFLNRAAEQLTGWSYADVSSQPVELIFRLVDGTSREPVPNPVNRVLKSGLGMGETATRDLLNRKGQAIPVIFQIYPLIPEEGGQQGAVILFRDQFDERQLEKRQQEIQALENVSILAGGIAHDFNNLLMGIQGSIALAMLDTDFPDSTRAHLLLTERAVTRAGNLGRQLLSLSRGNAPLLETVSARQMVEEICIFSLRGSGLGLELECVEDPWACQVDEGHISRVLNNLLINARQAMEGKGRINVRIFNKRVSSKDGLPLKPGPYLCIDVEDNGPGIPPEHLAQVFDPFFTTRRAGTGLGLANCKAILRENRGHIAMESEVGCGTLFTLYLPADLEAQVEILAVEEVDALYQGKGSVLLMDDEELIRAIAGELMGHLGFEALLTSNGEEALEKVKAMKAQGVLPGVIILDLTVPGKMGGLETKKYLEQLVPEIPVVVSSGYGNDPVFARFEEYGFAGAIQKPYNLRELGHALKSALESEPKNE